jgi:hypothetical protein
MKFMRRKVGYSLIDSRRNGDTLELKLDSVEKKLAQYKQKWLHHVSRMEDITDTQNNSLAIDLSEEEEEDLDDC